MIKRLPNGQYRLYSHDGSKNLGTFASLKQAKVHEAQVNYFKHNKK